MLSNKLNVIDGIDPEVDALRKLGNRIKILRMKAGHHNYEKFANQHGIGRILLRRVELGGNVKLNNLLKIIDALGVTPAEFFRDGFD
jgi:transcriptional regulator with XRE-family HTH domain